MNSKPIYTIAIPAFKGKYLKECIKSVLAQTFTDFELIIVNDCSPDPIDEVVSVFSDKRVRYYKNDVNKGAEFMVSNWNKCLQLAHGDYFVLLGDDDFMDENYLEVFHQLILQYPSLAVYHCRSKIVNDKGEVIDLTAPWPSYETVYDNMYYRLNMSRVQYISDFMYHTETLKAFGGFFYLPLAWGSDDITSFMACSLKGIAHCNTPVFNYRESAFTITRSGNAMKKMEAVLLQQKWVAAFLEERPTNLLDQICYRKLLKNANEFFLRRKADIVKDDLREAGIRKLIYWIRKKGEIKFPTVLLVRLYISVIRDKMR